MKAVIWTDVLQALVILVGLLATIIQGCRMKRQASTNMFSRTRFNLSGRFQKNIYPGGEGRQNWIQQVFSTVALMTYIHSHGYLRTGGTFFEESMGKLKLSFFFSISPDPRTRHTVWSLLIGGTLNSLSTYGFNQTQVQRYMCVRTTRGAKQALFINAVGAAIVILLCGFIGVILYAHYVNCDPYTAGFVSDIDQIFPYFVMETLSDKPGLAGVFLACIFSGSLSTISSGLNSLAAVMIEDVYKGLLGKKITDERQGFVSKIFSVVLGAVVILLTYIVSYLGSVLNAALSLFGVLSGPIMGVFFLGFFFPRANRRGGLVGFLVSLAFILWIFLGAQITKNQMPDIRLPLSTANCTTNPKNRSTEAANST